MLGKIGVLTMTRGRHDFLLAQVDGLSVGSLPPDVHSVVSMGDRDLTRGRLPLSTDRWTTVVKPTPTDRRALPLTAARNLAARNAIEAGAEVLVFLDDAVIPGERTLERFAEAVTGRSAVPLDLPDGPVLWRGPLMHLPPVEDEDRGYPLRNLDELGRRVPGTPPLAPGQLQPDPRWPLFSGASFAMSADDFERTGGFCTDYLGHGLEDADLAEVVRSQGGAMVWVGGADAYVQPAPAPEPEMQVRYALAHAQIWRQRWGAEPDHPWLTRLVAEGHLRRDSDGALAPGRPRR